MTLSGTPKEANSCSQEADLSVWFRSGEPKTSYVQGNTFDLKPVTYSELDGVAIFEGDIALGSVDQMESIANRVAAGGQIEFGVGITGAQFRWPNGVVPYEIDPNLPNQQRVLDAIRHWEERTPIRFPRRTAANAAQYPNYVQFFDGGGCWSYIGMRGGMQQISIGGGCSTGSTIHEIGHAVGLWHEQSREDRDRFVQILWANIQDQMRHNFDQHITDGDDIGGYDYSSIMHYPSHAFSKNGQPTIVPTGGQAIGQRSALSAGDIAAVLTMYPLWSDVKPVPGWFGNENQGADIAIADINGNGRPDLVVFHVDNPGGENHGYYRIGWNLDANGNPTNGWSDIKPVPGWFGSEDQGAGIAIADINGNGRPDLIIFHVDNPGGENHGYYRIGWNLDANGNPTGGWSNIKSVPGWFGSESQDAGIAIADVNGNGRPDLIIFHVDNPGGENHGYYRIGWNLDANGNPTGGWSNIKSVPGWFGSENQGAGIAIADLNGDGTPDLVVFHVDNPGGPNHGYYRIGWSLDANGNPTGGWSDVRAVPGWFGDENQGAGVAIANINSNQRPDLVVFHVDNPRSENHGYYRIGWDIS